MIRWLAILMTFLILLISLRDLLTYADFYANQDYITQNLCENLDKPELQCYGKCVLTDLLLENHEEGDNKTLSTVLQERTVFVLPTIVKIPNSLRSLPSNKGSIAYRANFYQFEYLEEVFHPPSIVS